MKALWLEDNRISLRDVRETRQPGEALIKIRKAGICSTDLELVKGYYPFTEPLAAALEIQQQVQVRPADRVLLVGAGRLGQLIAQTLALTGCDLRVVARHAHQQDLLRSRGIKIILEQDIQPWRWDIVVEATGSPGGFALARRAIRPRGTLVMKSTYRGDLSLNFSSIVVDEISIVGSRCGPFDPALRFMESRQVDPTVLIAYEFKLDEARKAVEHAAQPGALKVLIEA